VRVDNIQIKFMLFAKDDSIIEVNTQRAYFSALLGQLVEPINEIRSIQAHQTGSPSNTYHS
jgi:hypothetical protein